MPFNYPANIPPLPPLPLRLQGPRRGLEFTKPPN